MTLEQIEATNEAIDILQNHVDHATNAGRWLTLPAVAKQIRVSAWLKLEAESRKALTGVKG